MALGTANNLNGIGRDSPIINLAEITLKDSLVRGDTIHYTPAWETMNYFLDKRDYPWDETIGGIRLGKAIDRWMAVGEEPQAIEYSPRVEEIGMIVGSERKVIADGGIVKYVTPILEAKLPSNLIGKYLSKCETVEQAYENHKETPQYAKRDKFLEGKGCKRIANVTAYGSQKMGEDAKVIFGNDGGVALIFNANLNNIIQKYRYAYGLESGEEVLEFLLSHEDTHLYKLINEGTIDTIREEKMLEQLLKEFHEKLAKGESAGHTISLSRTETSEKGKYNRLAKANAKREENVEKNYAEHTFFGRILKGLKEEQLERIVEESIKEAKEAGCKTENEISKYVTNKIEKYAKSEEINDNQDGKEINKAAKESGSEETDPKETTEQNDQGGESK